MKQLAKAAVPLIALALAGCQTSQSTPAIGAKLLDDMPKVENSNRSPCWQQIQIAKQRAYIDTVRTGKEHVYRADCTEQPATS